MSDGQPYHPDPARVFSKPDFAREFTLLRERAGLTVRDVARAVRVPDSTVGGHFSGAHLPSPRLLDGMLGACGQTDPAVVEQWRQALARARRAPGRRPGGAPVPYLGLAAFQPEHTEWFHGRDRLTRLLLGRLAALHRAGGGLLVVLGPSGSGKSSLLRAGLIPAVRRGRLEIAGSDAWPVALTTPGARPLAASRAALPAGAGPCVLVVDQFEEVFTECADAVEREVFIAALRRGAPAALVPGGSLVVLGLRADFAAEALRHPLLAQAMQEAHVVVEPMTEAEVRQAIGEPARRANVDVEEGLVELLLRDLAPPPAPGSSAAAHDAGALPLLSHALYVTWERGRRRKLTVADYHATGGVRGAVARSAEEAYDGLTEARRRLARELFLRLVRISEDGVDTRRPMPRGELGHGPGEPADGELARVLDTFVARRLLTVDEGTVRITHEALLKAWPRLREWVDADRAGLVVGQRLADAAELWDREGRDPAALYGGTRLAGAREWAQAGHHGPPSPLVADFLASSTRRERRRVRRLVQSVVALLVSIVVTGGAAVAAVRAERAAGRDRDEALSQKAAQEALALRATNPALAAQLGLAAYRLAPTVEARGAVLSAFATPYATRLTGHTDSVYAAAYRPDGRLLATAGGDRVVRVWDVRDPHRPFLTATLTGHTGEVLSVAFSPDGRTLVTAGGDRTARLWDVSDPRAPRLLGVLTGHGEGIRSVAFAPDGRTVATASLDRTARLWNVADPRRPTALATLRAHTDAVFGVAFSPRGGLLATAGIDRAALLWDVSDPRHPSRLATVTGHDGGVLAVAFSPDGRTLATAAFDGVARLWDVTRPRHTRPLGALTGHESLLYAVAFSSDGRTAATGSDDNTIRLWDVSDRRRPATLSVLAGHSHGVLGVAFDPAGRTVASASKDNTVRLWDLHGPVLSGHRAEVASVTFPPAPGPPFPAAPASVSPSAVPASVPELGRPAAGPVAGRLLATGSYDTTARLWEVSDPYAPIPLSTLPGHRDGIYAIAADPRGRTLATAGFDFTARLWDIGDPRRPAALRTLAGHTEAVYAVAFRPDGRLLATAGEDREVRLWNPAEGRQAGPPFPRQGGAVAAVAFGAGGRVLATGAADHTATLWDVAVPARPVALATLRGHGNGVEAVAFRPDGRLLVTGGADRTARLWEVSDLGSPVLLATLTGHSDSVAAVAFSPDGRLLATGGKDRTVRLWDVGDPRRPVERAVLTGHGGAVSSVAFAPDGTLLATGSDDGTARLIDVRPEPVAARVCRMAYPRITLAEWRQYFPSIPYTPPCD
ncbi:helix-turn-helix domain-containing protein [Sphaerisporangium dianthi]|uniref:Helix-turn-helix domain-containing protein n=1 Tax=Sphaerisporangium dianthi TaxID=1436120 RepID=A0ABV9CGA5_9ACTN